MKNQLRNGNWPAYTNVWLLVLRVSVAAMMLTHGIPKLQKVLAGNFEFGDPIGIGAPASLVLATLAEVGCSVLVLLGLWTRFAVIPLAFTMLVAALVANAGKPFGEKELPLLYLLIFATLFVFGSGNYSLDNTLANRKRR